MNGMPFRLGLALLIMLVTAGVPASAAPVAATGSAGAEEEPKIEGQAIARAGGGWLGLKVEGGTFRLRFYDANKKPVAPDAARAVLRWKSNRRVAREVAILTPSGEPNLMTSEKSVPPPYNFRLTLVLMRAGSGESEADEAAAEAISIDFRQEPAAN
jgi:hypothetical protein